jgi:hypothetical protein
LPSSNLHRRNNTQRRRFMLKLARLIFGGGTSQPKGQDALIDEAIEKAVDACDPRLRAVSGYKKKLRDATGSAVAHVLAFVGAFAPPLDVSPQLFTTDPRVRAYFGSADQISSVFSDSRPVREFLARPENAPLTHFVGGMRMQLDEKRTLTSELRGDTVQREVLGTAMNFGKHYVGLVAADEKSLRRDIEERAFVRLIECALERMTAERERKSELEEQRALLKTKLQFIKARGLGMQPLLEPSDDSAPNFAHIEKTLEEVESKLRQAVPPTATLEHQIELMNDVMSHPKDYLSLGRKSAHITRMGMKADPGSTDPGDKIDYTEFTLGGKTWVGELVCYPVEAMLPPRKLGDLPRY